MQVTKRDGASEPVQFDKITQRLAKLQHGLDVDVTRVAAQVCSAIHDGISTPRLDELAADVAAGLSTEHPDYSDLAGRILVSNLQKNTSDNVRDTYEAMAAHLNPDFLAHVRRFSAEYQAMADYSRDFSFDFFGFKTIEKLYLGRVGGAVVERPQHMWLRVAIALWGGQLDKVQETYDYLSTAKFTHASPTLFNAGMKNQQLSSCFLAGIEEDSLEGIFDAIAKCAKISKFGGGIGLHVSGVRAKGAPIHGTNGASDGLVPMLRVVNSVAAYVNQARTGAAPSSARCASAAAACSRSWGGRGFCTARCRSGSSASARGTVRGSGGASTPPRPRDPCDSATPSLPGHGACGLWRPARPNTVPGSRGPQSHTLQEPCAPSKTPGLACASVPCSLSVAARSLLDDRRDSGQTAFLMCPTFFLAAQGGRRKGSVAIYIEPHHPDILDVLALKRNSGDEHLRARDL